MAYKTGNPALNKNTFNNLEAHQDSQEMTLNGVVNKSVIMLLLAASSGYAGWQSAISLGASASSILVGLFIVTLILAGVTVFKKTWSPITAPIYAILEGFLLGMLSQYYETLFDGIVAQALLITTSIFLALLMVYRSGLIKVTENFKLGVAAATGGIFLYYIVNFVIGFFGKDLPLINSTSIWGIGFSVFVVVLASLNLVLDFDFIENGIEKRAPKYMEWYASFGLFVTLVWLYIEILRLLAKLRD